MTRGRGAPNARSPSSLFDRARCLLLLLAAAASSGCAGGAPLLHPARVLPLGEVRAAAGFSANFAAAGLASAVRGAVDEAATGQPPGPPGTDAAYARGALVAAAVGPGLAPFIGARVGMGADVEGGLSYTGRSVRADVRRSFALSQTWSLSLGVGGSAVLYGRQDASDLPAVDLGELHGWGADVPVVIGYASDGDLYTLWLGARTGWEHVDIGGVTSVPDSVDLGGASPPLSATRFWGGGLLGAAVGFRHVHVAMEIDVSYEDIVGDFNQTHAQASGLAVAPAGALWWTF